MNICFLANYTKTILFDKVSKSLVEKGYQVFWITVTEQTTRYLIKEYGENKVLDLRSLPHDGLPVGDFGTNQLVYNDRALKHRKEWGINFLNSIQDGVCNFFEKNDIKYVYGEFTWSHEVLIKRMVDALYENKICFYSPHTVRIPNGRFGFFKDEAQSQLVYSGENKELVESFVEEKPAYIAMIDEKIKKEKKLIYKFRKLGRFVFSRNRDVRDPTIISNKYQLLKTRICEEFNKGSYRFVRRENGYWFENYNYVFIPLHKQPEASIDVIGKFYEDQYLNIINIWKALPDDWHILVKEHTNAIGDRSPFFYKKLLMLPKVHVVDESENSLEYIKKAKATITVSGTACYEAALTGVPSFTFGDTFFNNFYLCERITLEDLRTTMIDRLIEKSASKKDKTNIDPKKWVLDRSYPGTTSDPSVDASVLSDGNISNLSNAFDFVMQAKKRMHNV